MRTRTVLIVAFAALSTACNGSIYRPTRVPRLSAVKFLAFGDSMTEGVISTCPANASTMTLAQLMFALPATPSPPWSYPSLLETMMRERYISQLPSVVNRGRGGEMLSEGVTRLNGVLLEESPGAMLVLEGANDVNHEVPPNEIAVSLRAMIRSARARGIQSFVGTVLPQRPLGVSGSCRGFGAARVEPANDQIRSVVQAEGAVLVDLYQVLGGAPGTFIGPDGLHPTESGYEKIAEAFYNAVRRTLEE